jgi:hypothetical protein
MTGDERVVIQLFDAVDDALLAQIEMPLARLVARPAQTLTNVSASVRSLHVQTHLTSAAPDTSQYEDRGD